MATAQNNDTNRFLTIPLEIRKKIYELVLSDHYCDLAALTLCKLADSLINLSGHGLFSSFTPKRMLAEGFTSSDYHILCACSQTYAEARPTYFQHSMFILKDDWHTREPSPRQIDQYSSGSPVIRDMQRLTVHTTVLDLFTHDAVNLREVCITASGSLNLLDYLQSETTEERIAEAKVLDFDDLWQTCNERSRVWYEDPDAKSSIQKAVHANHGFLLKLRIRAFIASQGYRMLEVSEQPVMFRIC